LPKRLLCYLKHRSQLHTPRWAILLDYLDKREGKLGVVWGEHYSFPKAAEEGRASPCSIEEWIPVVLEFEHNSGRIYSQSYKYLDPETAWVKCLFVLDRAVRIRERDKNLELIRPSNSYGWFGKKSDDVAGGTRYKQTRFFHPAVGEILEVYYGSDKVTTITPNSKFDNLLLEAYNSQRSTKKHDG